MAKVKLVEGDWVKIKSDKLSCKIAAITSSGRLYLCKPYGWFKRDELRKLPSKRPEASKLAGELNFWKGRAKNISAQLEALANSVPSGSRYSQHRIQAIKDELEVEIYMVSEVTSSKINTLKESNHATNKNPSSNSKGV